jgi:hypothetical protein
VCTSESVTKTGRQTPSKCTGRQTPTKEVNYGIWVQLPGYRRYANRLLPVRNVGTDNAEEVGLFAVLKEGRSGDHQRRQGVGKSVAA